MKSRSSLLIGLRCYISVMLLDDLFHDAQADPGTGILMLAVQPLEEIEDLPAVAGLEADAAVGETDLVERPARRGLYGGRELPDGGYLVAGYHIGCYADDGCVTGELQ